MKKKTEAKGFEIDFFELQILIEASWHAGTILRYGIIDKAINTWYHILTPDQRIRIHSRMLRLFDVENEIQQIFMARYDPDNQFLITTTKFAECNHFPIETHLAFKWDNKYYINKTTYIAPEFIAEVVKVDNKG